MREERELKPIDLRGGVQAHPEMLALVGGILALVGGTILTLCAWALIREAASVSWPIARGVIVESEMLNPDRRQRSARIVYEYTVEVDGEPQSYRSDRIDFALSPGGGPETLLKAYPVGRSVQVRYDPEDPASAVLRIRRTRWDIDTYQFLGFMGFLLLVGLTLVGVAVKSLRQKERSLRLAAAARKAAKT